MSVVFMKQDEYKSPIDEIFEVGFSDAADISTLDTEFFSKYIGEEFETSDGKTFKVHSIMKDVLTEKFYALCQELIYISEVG